MARAADLPMKLLIVRGRQSSAWFSVRVILKNLEASYQNLGPGFESRFALLNYEDHITRTASHLELINQVREWRPDKLVIIDKWPHPQEALLILRGCGVRLPEIVFHVYGNFTIDAEQWLWLNDLLTDRKILFVAASERQASLVQGLTEGRSRPAVFPFPVDSRQFYWNPELRLKGRKKLGFSEEHKLLLYSGRLHIQKGVDHLAGLFTKFVNKRPNMHLLIAGEYDDTGSKVLNVAAPYGYYYRKLRRQLEELPAAARRNIHLLGNFEHKDLPELYCVSDALISLSLFHDDDYGMAMAEAGACGTPMLLSNWAGFSSFVVGGGVSLVDVTLGKQGLLLNLADAEAKFARLLEVQLSHAERERASHRFVKHFAIEHLRDRLEGILTNPLPIFEGFNSRLRELAERVKANTMGFPRSGGLYSEVYSSYLAQGQQL
jgi:glycosyltransferase involved in cell wall biosynthesis